MNHDLEKENQRLKNKYRKHRHQACDLKTKAGELGFTCFLCSLFNLHTLYICNQLLLSKEIINPNVSIRYYSLLHYQITGMCVLLSWPYDIASMANLL